MIKVDHRKAQAATELAVFGAILIFLLGTIVRTAVGNSYQQNQNFKAMRMAMLASWKGSSAHPGRGAQQDTSHNSAQILFIEDRLSPDYSKYGDLDRNPFIASGSGTFSYNLLYPLSDSADVIASLPVMDVYLNGQHFPFTMASYNSDLPIIQPTNCPYTPGSCAQNQCLRNQREWVGGPAGLNIKESSFVTPSVASVTVITGNCLTQPKGAAQRECQEENNACTIFTDLQQAQFLLPNSITGSCGTTIATDTAQGTVSTLVTSPLTDSIQWADPTQGFVHYYEASFPNTTKKTDAGFYNPYLKAILAILQGGTHPYRLFYTLIANAGGTEKSQFSTQLPPPVCTSPPAKDRALCSTLTLADANGNPFTNTNGEMAYDLLRTGYYTTPPPTCAFPPCQSVAQQFPSTACPNCLRSYMAWQWAATAGTTADMIGLNTSNNVFPTYDVDGRLKEVTIDHIWQDVGGVTHVSFEDSQGGDIDQSWDLNSCGPKPGLQEDSQIYTFTKNGTYLRINEGKLYNPETGHVVRSANKRDSIDLIQRTIQLTNNTGHFCSKGPSPQLCSQACSSVRPLPAGQFPCADCVNPNPVEVCVGEAQGNASDNCFTSANISQTCYDTNLNVIFVRSRLEDRRGRFWMTDTSGRLKVQ